MMLQKLNDYIFGLAQESHHTLNFSSISNVLFSSLELSPTSRSRVLLHRSQDDPVQQMLICFDHTSVVPLTYHKFFESFLCLSGAGRYVLYGEDYSVMYDILLSAYDSSNPFFAIIPEYTLHRFVPINTIVAYEVSHSHYDTSLTVFPDNSQSTQVSELSHEQILLTPLKRPPTTEFIEISTNKYYVKNDIVGLSKEDILSLGSVSSTVYFKSPQAHNFKRESIITLTSTQSVEFYRCTLVVLAGLAQITSSSFPTTLLNQKDLYHCYNKIHIEAISDTIVLHVTQF